MSDSRATDETYPIDTLGERGKSIEKDQVEANIDIQDGSQISEPSEELLKSLAKQLLYYLSSQNLSDDTYLEEILRLNSGHLPVPIVSRFSNITRIVQDSLVGDETISNIDVPGLVRKAAFRSQFLEVAVINQNGKLVAKVEDVNHKLETGRVTFFAIAPSSIRPTDNDISRPIRRDKIQGLGEKPKNDTANIIILRDVNEDATEETIRDIINKSMNTPLEIVDIRSEIGNYWFVTLGPNTKQEEMIDMLLSLRNTKICNEPIKARLKTQRLIINNHSTPIESLVPSSPGYNPYKAWNRNKSSGASPKRSFTNQVYTGDRVNYGSKKHFNSEKRRGQGGASGSSKSSRATRGNTKSHSNGTSINKGNVGLFKDDIQEKIVLPPPSCEKNFPSLGGQSAKLNSVDDNKMESERKDLLDGIDVVQKPVTAVTAIISSREHPSCSGGYAAALRKIVSNTEDIVPTAKANSSQSCNVNKPLEQKRPVPRQDSVINSIPAKSSGTAATDDASSDDKSSLSSKPESDRSLTTTAGPLPSSTIVTTRVTSVGWGRGRSFAEIVKKQEATEIEVMKN